LLLTLLTVTTTGLPVVTPLGIVATMLVELQVGYAVAWVPLNVTVLVPRVEPKFEPVIVAEVPPGGTYKLEMLGGAPVTVKLTPLLGTPSTVTTTLPVLAPLGTEVEILPVPQPVVVAKIPLNVTVLFPFVEPKFEPEIVTSVPTVPV
jgi:hypothetical protein